MGNSHFVTCDTVKAHAVSYPFDIHTHPTVSHFLSLNMDKKAHYTRVNTFNQMHEILLRNVLNPNHPGVSKILKHYSK